MIRKFEKSDYEFFMECSKEFYSSSAVLHNVSEENFKTTFDLLMSKSSLVDGVIFECDNERAGFALMSYAYSNEVGGLVMWLEEAYILPKFQGKGLATSFFQYVKSNYGDKVKRFRLEVAKTNARAVRLYERMNFEQLDYLQMYIEN